ncbi:Bug family tripartite tricarboxylate transporter substrate binding protein [Muricoccus radiodurans]|uniref:Bug family tripartite tricarboxylate transporter substrate binding protein n=1 Tax=Muricoccus radiodurans TaxID=2231721 RepID=UPI003CE8C8D0
MTVTRRSVLGAAAAPLVARAARAQESWSPDRPIRMVVGFAPGGGTDITARAMAPRLSALLGQPVVVENRPGAGGNIATEAVARATPDGHTMLMGTIAALAVNPALYASLPFNPLTDLTAVALAVTTHDVLVVHPSTRIRTVSELIERARGAELSYGTSGIGTAGHLSGELFNLLAGVKLTHVPYRGGGALANDLLSGQVPISFASVSTAAPMVDTGRLVGLATTGSKRSDRLPALPTVAEAGVRDFESSNWYGLVGPRGMPPAMVARWNRAMNEALSDPGVLDVLQRQGLEAEPGTPEAFLAFMRSETEKWGRVMRAAGARAE